MVTVAVGNVASSVGGALATHFFGKRLDQKLTIEKFQEFHTHLNTEILLMEVCVYMCVFGGFLLATKVIIGLYLNWK